MTEKQDFPTSGGSYRRDADGALIPASDSKTESAQTNKSTNSKKKD